MCARQTPCTRMLVNIRGFDYSYPQNIVGFNNWDEMTEGEASMIPWHHATEMGTSLHVGTNIRTQTYSFPATHLSDRLPNATKVVIYSCPMHSFMMGELPRLGQASAIRLLEGKQEIFRMIKSFTPQG